MSKEATTLVDEEVGTVTSTSKYSTYNIEKPPVEHDKILLLKKIQIKKLKKCHY
jgi:hypothetical protein